MPSNDYVVVLYPLNSPERRLLVARRASIGEARKACQQFAGKGWDMHRRPDVHTWGDLVMTINREVKLEKRGDGSSG